MIPLNKSEKEKEEKRETAEEKNNIETKDDCIFCRITGSILFGGVSFYSFLKFMQANKRTTDKKFFGFISVFFGCLSLYRAITPARPLPYLEKINKKARS